MQAPLVGWRGDAVHVGYVAPRAVYRREAVVAGHPVVYRTTDGVDLAE